jgi:hypothetical protein
MLGLFAEWSSRRKKFEPEGHVVAGRLAEFRLLKLARAVSGNALVLEGVRIPDPTEGGRREIDMVIATENELLFVEQKHWSGSFVIQEDGRFFQTRANGGTLLHKDIVAWTARKGELLCDIHEGRCRQPPPPGRTVLVFSNSNLKWKPLPKDVPAEAYDELGFIDMLENMNKKPPSDEIRTTLGGFGTWDAIHLNGGKTIHGDILELGLPIERGSTIIVEQKAGLFSLFTGPTTIINGSVVVTDQRGVFASIVGEAGNRTIPWANIEKIVLSNPKAEWG